MGPSKNLLAAHMGANRLRSPWKLQPKFNHSDMLAGMLLYPHFDDCRCLFIYSFLELFIYWIMHLLFCIFFYNTASVWSCIKNKPGSFSLFPHWRLSQRGNASALSWPMSGSTHTAHISGSNPCTTRLKPPLNHSGLFGAKGKHYCSVYPSAPHQYVLFRIHWFNSTFILLLSVS